MVSELQPIDVAHAALLEAGRRDLADWIHGWEDEDGFYLESDDPDILTETDWAVIDKAEVIARQSIGLCPRGGRADPSEVDEARSVAVAS